MGGGTPLAFGSPLRIVNVHWSSTTRSDLPGAAWYVDFDDADVDSAGKESALNVRAVRGGL